MGLPLIVPQDPELQDQIKEMQRLLNQAGYDAGKIDGIIGDRTWGALSRYMEDSYGHEGVARRVIPELDALGDQLGRHPEIQRCLPRDLEGSRLDIAPDSRPEDGIYRNLPYDLSEPGRQEYFYTPYDLSRKYEYEYQLLPETYEKLPPLMQRDWGIVPERERDDRPIDPLGTGDWDRGIELDPVEECALDREANSGTLQLQRGLEREGFSPGEPDGIFGPKTNRGLDDYVRSHGLDPDKVRRGDFSGMPEGDIKRSLESLDSLNDGSGNSALERLYVPQDRFLRTGPLPEADRSMCGPDDTCKVAPLTMRMGV